MSNSPLDKSWRVETDHTPIPDSGFDIYMIIEPELWPDWKAQVYREVAEPNQTPIFENTQFANIDGGPVLVGLNEKDNMFDIAVERMRSSPCGCLLYVEKNTPQENLLTTLRNGLVVGKDNATALLRYYEPRTLLPLFGSMSNQERSLQFQNISQIYWFHYQWFSVGIFALENNVEQYRWELTSVHISTMQSILTQHSGA